MELKEAKLIRELRIDKKLTWRGIAYEMTNGKSSNQITGMNLCETAMKLLGEKEEDGWN